MDTHDVDDRALLVAMPSRHLEPARAECEARGSVVLPAGGPGDLGEAPAGSRVLLIATDGGDAEVPAATWSARFEGPLAYAPGDPFPTGLPETWLDEHADRGEAPVPQEPDDDEDEDEDHDEDDDEDDDDGYDDEDAVGPQSFFRVSGLSPLPTAEWVFTNELVPKQQRRGRSFIPRTPLLIEVPE
ncbi:MAG: hypothetical protein ACRDHI_10685 [Actinomycetota bacterium]